MSIYKQKVISNKATVAAGMVIVVMTYFVGFAGGPSKEGSVPSTAEAEAINRTPDKTSPQTSVDPLTAQSIELSTTEFQKFKIEPAVERRFTTQCEAVGNIDVNEEMLVPVFPPVQGKILTLFAKASDDVKKGALLYTIDSPDLVQAESSLINTAGTRELTTHVLQRARQLHEVQGLAQKDVDQAIADQQAAEGAYRAARDAVRIFGKTEAEMDRIIAERKIDSMLVVRSPITGRVTARNAAPGLLVQPGTAPAPYTVADLSTIWLLANVAETDFPLLRLGEEVQVTVKAYPGRLFRGTVINIGTSVDPLTHRVSVRSEIVDPKHELRPGMFATFVITTGDSIRSPAVPLNGVIREGDGTMTVWVATASHQRLVQRTVKVGLEQDGFVQILEGLKPGELTATEGALFLSSALTTASR